MINCIAIDDEPLALTQLTGYISRVPFLNLVASCQDAFDAMSVLSAQKIDLMFVDINMPDLNGMDFVRSLTEKPLVIFTTAYSEYPAEGFKVDALDYLLKPGTEEELVTVLEEAIRLLNERTDGLREDRKEILPKKQEKKKDIQPESGNIRMSAVAENIRQYISMHYKEDISLQSVAEEMNYSDAYFCKIFKQCFDKSFIVYLTEFRMEQAKQLLADVRINVKDISTNVGYRDSNYFAKVFKRAVGSTPTEYRMEVLKQMETGNAVGGLG